MIYLMIDAVAFESVKKLYKCCACDNMATHFHMMRTKREKYTWKDDEGRVMTPGLCVQCEIRERKVEWAGWSAEQQTAQPSYCESQQVRLDIKRHNRGTSW